MASSPRTRPVSIRCVPNAPIARSKRSAVEQLQTRFRFFGGMSSDNEAHDAASTQVLSAILNEIGAIECLAAVVEDYDDDALKTLSKLKPERIASRFGMALDKAIAFVGKCLEASACRGAMGEGAAMSSSSPPPFTSAPSMLPASPADNATSSTASTPAPASAASLVDAASLLRKLNLDVVAELGEGGFGTVYKCKDAVQKRFVAVKLVSDTRNAQEALREGQKLLRAKHKNIVQLHRVHDLSPICALEMEVVTGGDLFKHLEAAHHRPERRLPAAAVLRLSRQLLESLIYLHDEMKWLHGDIKPQNILLQCSPVPADGSAIDYSDAEIKVTDFGLAKVMEQEHSSTSFMLTNASTVVGVLKGTAWYLSPEALQGAFSDYERTYSDDLWSACLVIYEMDTGLTLQQLMTAPGAIKLEELLTKTSRALLPLLASVLAVPDAASRCKSAAELLQKLDASLDPLYIWEEYDATAGKYVGMHPAVSFYLESAFSTERASGHVPRPFDINFDIKALLSSATALGSATDTSGAQRAIRRLLKPSALTSSCDIPIWQQLVDGKEWLQCPPATCAKLETDASILSAAPDSKLYRRIVLQPGSIGSAQLPLAMKSEPYCAPAQADDMAILSNRVHDSLPEWDISDMVQVVNPALASKYADNRHRLAARCNGNPNERMLFHSAADSVIPKIWQAGEGFETRLAQWAEVGKGAYFSEHIIYNYALKFDLWAPPDKFKVVAEPPLGAEMRVFAVLVCLGNVADMGPGCESCPSPAFIKWKKEFDYQKKAPGDNPLPTRPPIMELRSDAAHTKHVLELLQVKDGPRYDSVMSTEGDLATHPHSNCKTAAGQPMRDVMHPRLKTRAKEWGKQYVLSEWASYPVFLLTLKKTRSSPMGPQQLLDEGCDLNRLKALGCTASDFKALGKTVHEMKVMGWNISDLIDAKYDPRLICKEFTASALRDSGFTIKDLQDAGHGPVFISQGFTPAVLKNSGYGLSEMKLILREYKASALRDAGFTIKDLQDAGHDLQFISEGFTPAELKNNGYGLSEMKLTLRELTANALKRAGFTIKDLQEVSYDLQFISKGFTVKELKNSGYQLNALKKHFDRRKLGDCFSDHELEQEGIMRPVDYHDVWESVDVCGTMLESSLKSVTSDIGKCLFFFSRGLFQDDKHGIIGWIWLPACSVSVAIYFFYTGSVEHRIVLDSIEMNAINASYPVVDDADFITSMTVGTVFLILSLVCWAPLLYLVVVLPALILDVILLPFFFSYFLAFNLFLISYYIAFNLLGISCYIALHLLRFLSYLSYQIKTHCFASPRRIHPLDSSKD